MFTVSTVNVNGVRAAARKGYLSWLAVSGAEVIALQEVRAEATQLPAELAQPEGWHTTIASSTAKGRAGVALLSRTPPAAVRIGLGDGSGEFDAAGRYLEYELDTVIVASLYLPSGEVGTVRQEQKERFMAELAGYLGQRRATAEAAGKELLVAGDWNIAHTEADLKNARANRNRAGFLPTEREWLSRVLAEAGFVDVHRSLAGDGPGPYSWWSYRGKAFDNDAGWRIDYQLATPKLAASAVKATVERAPSYDARWSDHAPVTITYSWPP